MQPEIYSEEAKSVLVISDHFLTGGTRTYAFQLLLLLRERGLEVTLLHLQKEDPGLFDFAREHSIELLVYFEIFGPHREPPRSILHDFSRLRSFIKQRKPDLVVATVGTPGRFLAALAGIPGSLYILHTIPSVPKNLIKHWIYRQLFVRLTGAGPRIITVSRFARDRIEQLWPRSQVKVCYSTAGSPLPVRAEPGLPLLILTVGHVVRYKGILDWLEVIQLVREKEPGIKIRFVWIGDGDMLSEARSFLIRNNLGQIAELPGHQSQPGDWYEKAHIYFQPSQVENLSLSVLDALRHGLPCVTTRAGGLSEQVEHDENGYLTAEGDTIKMHEALLRLARDSTLRKRMSEVARSKYQALFAPGQWKHCMDSQIQDALSRRKQ